MVAAGAKRGPPPASSGASSAAYKSAPVAPTVGKRVVNGLQALKRAATVVVSAAKGSTTVTAPTTASSSVRLASDVGGAHHHRHSTAPSAPLKKLTIRAPSGYTTNVAVMWRRWFCSAPARQALLDQFGAAIKWNTGGGGNALNSRSGSITTQTESLNISELSKLHNHCPRLQVALACCRQVEALLATSSLNFVDSDDASSESSVTAMQPLLRAIVAAVPVVSNDGAAARRHIFSRFEAMTIIDRVRRVAILTESWDLATRMLPVVRGGEDEEGSAVLFVQKLVQLAQQQSHYLHRLSLQPLFVPSGGHSVAGIQSCSEFDPATRLVLANVLSALEEAATPPPNTWSSEESNNRRPSVTTTSSTALRLRSGVSIEINRERTIATAFALCEQHRLFGLPATLRFLRRNKQQTSWAAHSPSTLSKHAKNELSGDAMPPKAMASSFFPSTRHLPCEWFDIKFHRDGALDLDSTAVDNANTEILKSVLGKEIVSSTAALKDEEGKHHHHHNDGIHFAVIAGDADIMTQLLWEYLQIGQGQHSSQDGDDLTHVEQSNGCSGGGDDEAQPQKEQKWLGKRSKLFAILENEIARNEDADDRAQLPSSSASASKINIGGKEHLVPRVSATWVPGSVAHHLRYVPSIGPIAEVRGPHADVYSLAIVFGVMGTSTPAASATHELHNRVFLCSVLELARP